MLNNHVHVRPATSADVPLIFAFIKELADYEKLSHEVVATEDQIRATLFGARPMSEVVIASLDGTPVGFALFFPSYSTFLGRAGLYLEDLFVRPAYRRRGLGVALMRRLADEAVKTGCGRFQWQVLDWNEPSISFYKKLGAEPLEDWTVYRVTGAALQNLAKRT